MNRILLVPIYSHILKVKNGVHRKRHSVCWISTLRPKPDGIPGNDDTGTMSHGLFSI